MTDVSTWSQTDGSNTSTAPAGAPEGMAPSAVNDVLRAIMGSVAREQAHINATVTSGGSADVQTLTYTVAPSAYFTGQRFAFIAGYTNATTTPTLNVNSLGAKTIVQADGSTALRASQITAGTTYEVAYDGTNFRLISGGAFSGPASSTNNGFVLFNGTSGQTVKDAGYSTVPVSAGGTGSTSLTANNVLLGNGTSAVQVVAPSTSGNVLTSNGTTWTSATPTPVGVKLISAQTGLSAVSAVSFTSGIDSTYDEYILEFRLLPATDAVHLLVEVSTDGGSTWKTTGTQYVRYSTYWGNTNSPFNYVVGASTDSISNTAATGGVAGQLRLYDPSNSTTYKHMTFHCTFYKSSSDFRADNGGVSWNNATTAINAIRLKFDSGNIASGYCRLYGVRAS